MNTLTEKQTIIFDAMKTNRIPAGVGTIMTWCKGMDSKTQIKAVLDQLVKLGEVKLQSNGQYALINKAPEKAKPTPRKPVKMVAQPSDKTPENNQSETVEKLKKELEQLQYKIDQMHCDILKMSIEATNTDSMSAGDLIRWIKQTRKDAAAVKQETITPRAGMDAIMQMITGIFNDHTSVIIYADELPEIVCDGIRYEIPVGSDKETTGFMESLSWVSGQRIENAA